MNEQAKNNWSTGRLVPLVAPSNPPIEVDCSNWESDIPAEKWSTGRLVPLVAPSNPPIEVDCSNWEVDIPAEVYLEITVHLAPTADPAKSVLFATRMSHLVYQAFPELELQYDQVRSRADAGTVVISLASSNGELAEQKLEAVTQTLRAAAADFPMASLHEVRLARAA